MRFQIGDKTDNDHCTALHHEFLRCEEAFKDFEKYGKAMIMEEMKSPVKYDNRYLAFKAYNAYSQFVFHLYEFFLGCATRDRQNTETLTAEMATRYIWGEAQRTLNARRDAILNGTAPSWENHISYYPEKVPPEFAREFRLHRNKIIGHVTHERSGLSLSEFYHKYHKYLHMMYWNGLSWWGLHRHKEFPDLKEITDFSVMIRKDTQEG